MPRRATIFLLLFLLLVLVRVLEIEPCHNQIEAKDDRWSEIPKRHRRSPSL